MSAISLRLPDSVYNMAREIAREDHISLNQFIASAVAEKISPKPILPSVPPEVLLTSFTLRWRKCRQ